MRSDTKALQRIIPVLALSLPALIFPPCLANAGTLSGSISYEGSQQGALTVRTWQPKPGNRALRVDGDGDYVVVDTLTDLSGPEITIQYWFQGSSFQSAVRQQSGGWIVAGWNGQHILSHDGGTNGISAGNNVSDGSWHQLTMTWKQGTSEGFRSYLDGQLVETRDSVDTPVPQHGAPTYFGAFNGVGEFSSGWIDEVAIWSRALTEAEVTANWFRVLGGDEEGLVGLWDFDQEGEMATDLTGNEFEGFAEGDASFELAEIPGLGGGVFSVQSAEVGPFTIDDVPDGEEYRVFAFIDVNGNGVADRTEPSGSAEDLLDVNGELTGVDIVLTEQPVVLTAPEPQIAVAPGGTLVLEATVSGTAPLSFEWQLDEDELENGARISGVNTNRLEITDFQGSDAGIYRLVVSNALGRAIAETQVVEQVAGFEVSGSISYDGELGAPGREGNMALALDGDGDFVRTPLRDLSGDELTIQYWFKGSSIQSAVRQQSGGWIVAGWNDLHILSHDGGVGGVSAGTATDGVWHHIAMTWKRGTSDGFRTYLDGEMVESRDSVDAQIPDHDADLFLGAFNGAGEFTNGMLDEVSVWRRALTIEEIQAAMNAPLNGNEAGLAGYWNFDDGTAKDLSGNGFDGTLNGDAAIVDGSDIGASGDIVVEIAQVIQGNRVLCLDGEGDFVSVATVDDLSGSELTIQYWFKGSSIQSAVRQQAAGFIVAGWNNQHILSNDGATAGISAGNATDGKWHSLVMTWKQDTVGGFASYLDGELIASRDSSNNPLPFNGAPLFFGAFNGAGEFMNGCLDEIAVWNRALSAGEVRANWNSPLRGNESGLIGYWFFDDGTAGDATASEHDGELFGDATTIEEDLPGFGGARLSTAIQEPGAFAIPNVPEGEDYFLTAYFDRNNNGQRDPDEPFGAFADNPIEVIGARSGIAITLIDPVTITKQPVAVAVQQGASPSLTVEVAGADPFIFSWMKNGQPLEDEAGVLTGTKTATLQFASITTDDAGGYSVTISNAGGSVTSDVVSVQVAPDDIDDDLIGYWKFDETTGTEAADSSDGGRNTPGTLINFGNADAERWVDGQVGGALRFDPEFEQHVIVNDYVKPDAAMTASAWVNADTLATWGSIIKNWGGAQSGQFHFGLQAADGDLSNFLTTDDGSIPNTRTGTAFSTGDWHHVAFTANGSTMVIYQDGVAVADVAYSGPLVDTVIPNLGIGVKTDDTGEVADGGNPGYWDGLIDDIGLWRRALTPAEIGAIYRAGLQGIPLDQASLGGGPAADPDLQIRQSGGGIVLSWSALQEGWILKSTADLSTGNWTTVEEDVTNDGNRNVVTLNTATPAAWYRLERP